MARWFVKDHAMPHSRLFTFEHGSDELLIEGFMHTDEYRPQGSYAAKQQRIKLSKAYCG